MEQPNSIPHPSSMQRPQPGNPLQQIHAKILDDLRKSPPFSNGWQSTFDVKQRSTQIVQLVTHLRLLQQNVTRCIKIAEDYEYKTIGESANAQEYFGRMKMKLNDIAQKRQTQASQQLMQQNGGSGGVPMNQNVGNFDMSQADGVGGMDLSNGQMDPNAIQQGAGFPSHLQRQMQPSPLPPQHQQLLQQQNNKMDPSTSQQSQMQSQMSVANHLNGQPVPMVNQGSFQGQAGRPSGPLIPREVMIVAKQMYEATPETQRNQMRQKFMSSLNQQQLALLPTTRGDPLLMRFFTNRASDLIMKQRTAQQQQQHGGFPVGSNQALGTMQQPGQANGGVDFSSILVKQANALKQQESGEQVVPASNNQKFNLGSAGVMSMPQNINPQMLGQQGGNQLQSNNNTDIANTMQLLKTQQERQQQIQRQNAHSAMAHQQAQAHVNQLRGQPGGLNAPNALNGGPVGQQLNSPNFTMLNKPMVPPGQSAPSTPQQPNRQQGVPPQTPTVNPATQLMQHHQQMLNQNQVANPQQQMNHAQLQQRLLEDAPESLRKRLQHMPAEKVREVLERIAAQRGHQSRNFAGSQPRPGQQPAVAAPLPTGMNMPNSTRAPHENQQQQPLYNFTQTDLASSVPSYNSQPPTQNQQQLGGPLNQQGQHQAQMDALQNRQLQQQQHQQQQLHLRAMDQWPFPRALLTSLGIATPQQVQLWGQLKDHIRQHQSVLPDDLAQKLRTMQIQWFETHPEDTKKAVQALRNQIASYQLQQNGGQQVPIQNGGGMPPGMMSNGQAAAPAQMVPRSGNMRPQQNPNQPPMSMPPQSGSIGMNSIGQPQRPPFTLQMPTQQEINDIRSKNPVQTQNLSDEQIRNMLTRKRIEAQNQRPLDQAAIQYQAMLRQQHLQRAQINGGQQQLTGQLGGLPRPQKPTQSVPQRQIPLQQPNQGSNGQSQGHGQNRQQPQPQSATSSEVMEIPNPNALQSQMGAPQAPPMQPSRSQQRVGLPQGQKVLGMPNVEQLNRLPPDQRVDMLEKIKRMDALRRANAMNSEHAQQQQQQQNQQQQQQQLNDQQLPTSQHQPDSYSAFVRMPNVQILEAVRSMHQQIAQSMPPRGPQTQLDPKSMELAQGLTKKLWPMLRRVDQTFLPYLRAGYDPKRLRDIIRAKILLQRNAALDDYGNIQDYFGLTLQQVQEVFSATTAYFTDVKRVKDQMEASNSLQQSLGQHIPKPTQIQQPQVPPPSAVAKPQQQAPQLGKTTSQRGHTRKASSNSKAPPAPTENKTFDWGVTTADGVPKYEVRNELTPDKLKFPPQKKRRTGQPDSRGSTPVAVQGGTPGATLNASPGVSSVAAASTKALSIEQVRKNQPPLKQESEDQKQKLQQPRKFKCRDPLCEASIQGCESEEELSKHIQTEHAPTEDPLAFLLASAAEACGVDQEGKPLPSKKDDSAMKARPKLQPAGAAGLKIDSKALDMKREVTSSPSNGKVAANATTNKASDASTNVPSKEKTLREVLEGKIGFEHPTADPSTNAPSNNAEVDSSEEIFQDIVRSTLHNSNVCDDWDLLGQADNLDWDLRADVLDSDASPDLTPSDGTASSRASDISQSERLRINFEWDPFGNEDTHVPEMLRTLGLGDEMADGDAFIVDTAADADADKSGQAGQEGGELAIDDKWDWTGDDIGEEWDLWAGMRGEGEGSVVE